MSARPHLQPRRTLALAIAVSVDDLVTAIHVRSRIVRNLIDFTPEATLESEDIEARLRNYLENPEAIANTDAIVLPHNLSTTASNSEELSAETLVEESDPVAPTNSDEFLECDEDLTTEYVKMRCAGDIPPTPVVSPGPKKASKGKRPAEEAPDSESSTLGQGSAKKARMSAK